VDLGLVSFLTLSLQASPGISADTAGICVITSKCSNIRKISRKIIAKVVTGLGGGFLSVVFNKQYGENYNA